MTTAVARAEHACRKLRYYPVSTFWVLSCFVLAAGVIGSTWSFLVMALILATEVTVIAHVVHKTYDPQRWSSHDKR